MKAVFTAADWEIKDAVESKKFGFEKICDSPFEVWRNDTRYIIISGIGLVNASSSFFWACGKFEFESAVNVGMAGKTMRESTGGNLDETEFGGFYEISKVCCLEPYNKKIFMLSEGGRSLVSSSRPAETQAERIYAGKYAELVDMEGYSFARAAELLGKKLSIYKLVSDFSPNCDIYKNILSLQHKLAEIDSLWIG